MRHGWTMRVAALAAVVIGAACSSGAAPGSASPVREAGAGSQPSTLDDTLHVPLGGSASTDSGRLVLTFVARLADSRCPANVVCVWMGDAAIRVAARTGRSAAAVELHTGLEPRSLTIDGYVVTVVGLLPYPGTEIEGRPAATTTALLRVTRRQ